MALFALSPRRMYVCIDGRGMHLITFRALHTGDYSIKGYEDVIALERKSLQDMVGSLMNGRSRFLAEMERLAQFPYKCLCIESSRTVLKTPYRC